MKPRLSRDGIHAFRIFFGTLSGLMMQLRAAIVNPRFASEQVYTLAYFRQLAK
jgi:hypothetical protein